MSLKSSRSLETAAPNLARSTRVRDNLVFSRGADETVTSSVGARRSGPPGLRG